MDSSHTFNIPLDSPLDINKSDMFVSVKQPKFSFNRQKMLGGVMQSSVRYEDDGYFAGWWRHNFDLISIGDNSIRPNLYGLDDEDDLSKIIELEARNLVVHNRETSRGVPFYVLQERKTGLKFSFSPDNWSYWSTGYPSAVTPFYDSEGELLGYHGFQRINDTDILIAGLTQKNVPFSVVVDIYTGEIKSSLPVAASDESLLPSVLFEDDALHVIISKILEPKNDWFIYRANTSLLINNNLLDYERDEYKSVWGRSLNDDVGEFELTDDGILSAVGDEFAISEYEKKEEDTLNEHVVAICTNKTIADIIATVEYDDVWTGIKYTDVEPLNEFIGNASSNVSVNKQSVSIVNKVGSGAMSTVDIAHGLPVWFSYRLTDIDIYVLNNDPDNFKLQFITANCKYQVITPRGEITESFVKWQIGHAQKGSTITAWQDFSANISQISIPKNERYIVAFRCVVIRNNFIIPNNSECFRLSHEFFIEPTASVSTVYKSVSRYSLYDLAILKSVEITSYESKYYKMLNKLSYKEDVNLVDSYKLSNSNIDSVREIRVPVCILGYAFYRVEPTGSPGIVASDIRAFKVSTLSNPALNYPEDCVRIDYDYYEDGFKALMIVEPVLRSVSTGNDIDEQIVSISLDSINEKMPLYITTVPENDVDDDGNRIVSTGMYPVWTVSDLGTSNVATSEEMKPFFPSQSTGIVSHVKSIVTISKKIADVSFSTEYNRSLYNSSLFDKIEPSYDVTELYAGGSHQDLTVYLNSYKTEYIRFVFNNTSGFGASVTTELSTYSYVSHVTPLYNDQLQKITISLRSLEEFTLQLYRSFIYKLSGFTIPSLHMLSQVRDEALLSDGYGQLDLSLSTLHSSKEVSFINVDDVSILQDMDIIFRLEENGDLYATTDIVAVQETLFRIDIDFALYVTMQDPNVFFRLDNDCDFYASSIMYSLGRGNELNFKARRYYIAENNTASIRLIPKGIFQRKGDGLIEGPRNVSFGETQDYWNITFALPGTNSGSNIAPHYLYDDQRLARIDKETKLNLLYETKDIRDKSSPKAIYQNDLTGMRQFVKQFWSNDTATENYWWVDKDYVLEKTDSELILWKKNVDEVDDWMGDKWSIYKHAPHQNFFGIKDIYYNVSSAKDSYPVLYKLQATHNYSTNTGSIRVLYMRLDPVTLSNIDFNNPEGFWQSTNIDVITLPFGEALRTGQISAFIDLNPASIISSSSISSTVVDGVFMLGFAYSRGLLQWTIRFNPSGAYDVFNGYGCVGLDGSLTGGQIPMFSSGANGFNANVYDVKDLEKLSTRHLKNEPDANSSILPNKCYEIGRAHV